MLELQYNTYRIESFPPVGVAVLYVRANEYHLVTHTGKGL